MKGHCCWDLLRANGFDDREVWRSAGGVSGRNGVERSRIMEQL